MALALAVLAGALPVAAANPVQHVDVTVGTDFPVRVGAGVTVEGPLRLRASMHAGALPEGYVDTINWGLTTFDVYSDTVAELIDILLQNSVVLRWDVGWRPLADRGLFVSGGLQILTLNGNTTDVSTLRAGIEGGLADGVGPQDGDIVVVVRPKMLHGEVGYEWLIRERFVVRSTAAFAYTLSNRTEITAADATGRPDEAAGTRALDAVGSDYLDYVFEEWVHLPTIGLSAGVRF